MTTASVLSQSHYISFSPRARWVQTWATSRGPLAFLPAGPVASDWRDEDEIAVVDPACRDALPTAPRCEHESAAVTLCADGVALD